MTKIEIVKVLKRVAGSKGSLTRQQYRNRKRISDPASSTIELTFGSFTGALKRAKIGG